MVSGPAESISTASQAAGFIVAPNRSRNEYAAGYIARGWKVFVLSASKKPIRNCDPCKVEHTTQEAMEKCECLTCHGFYAATTDPSRLTAMLDRHPSGLLAVRTGSASGLAVVDVDFRNWTGDYPASDDPAWVTMSGLDRDRLLPGTLMQTTGGGGLHFLYEHPGGYLLSGAKKYGPGVDSKADGGYIVVAPSVSKSGPYGWTGDGRFDHPLTPLPEGLASMVRPPAPVARLRSARLPTGLPGARTRLGGLLAVVLGADDGERNYKLYWAAKKAGEMVAAGEVDQSTVVAVLMDAGRSIGLPPSEVGDAERGTICSGLNKGFAAVGRVSA